MHPLVLVRTTGQILGFCHLLLVFTDAAHFPHTHHLHAASFLRRCHSIPQIFSKLLFSICSLYLKLGCTQFSRLVSGGATPVARCSFLQCRSIPLRIPQAGSHQAKLCHNTVRPLCPALLCCCCCCHTMPCSQLVCCTSSTAAAYINTTTRAFFFLALFHSTPWYQGGALRGTKALLSLG